MIVPKRMEIEYMERKERIRKFFESNRLKGVRTPIDDKSYIIYNIKDYIKKH